MDYCDQYVDPKWLQIYSTPDGDGEGDAILDQFMKPDNVDTLEVEFADGTIGLLSACLDC
jgi:hypothetical protein